MATTTEPEPTTISETTGRPTTARAWGTDAADQPLRPMEIERRALRPDDVAIRITYSGICHTDLHQCRNDWHGTIYPICSGARNRRRSDRSRAGGHQVQGRRYGRGRNHRRFRPYLP